MHIYNFNNVNMLESILFSLNNPIVVLDKKNTIVFVNPAFEELLSLSKSILIKKRLNLFIDDYSPFFLLLDRVRKNRSSLSEDSLVLSFKNNVNKKLKVNVFPTINHEDYTTVQFTESIISDKFVSYKINSKISQSFSSMVNMLMHELKNPLSGITGAAQLLEKDLKGKNNLELTKLIRSETERINKLLSSMENISLGEGNIDCNFINIHEILNYCKKISENSFGKNVNFKEDYDPSLPLVYGNYDLLIQIFLNLIKNACEAKVNNSLVILKTSYNSNKLKSINAYDIPETLPLQVEVIDNGIGIKDDQINNIFNPFITSKKSGYGLGLSIVSSGLNSLGASIEVLSKRGETNFCINFPYKENLKG